MRRLSRAIVGVCAVAGACDGRSDFQPASESLVQDLVAVAVPKVLDLHAQAERRADAVLDSMYAEEVARGDWTAADDSMADAMRSTAGRSRDIAVRVPASAEVADQEARDAWAQVAPRWHTPGATGWRCEGVWPDSHCSVNGWAVSLHDVEVDDDEALVRIAITEQSTPGRLCHAVYSMSFALFAQQWQFVESDVAFFN